MKHTLLATLSTVVILGSSVSSAASIVQSISGQGIYLDPAASSRYQQIINDELFDIGIDPEMSAFKVPANKLISYICTPVQLQGQVNPCGKLEQQTTLQCPTTIPMKWPDGSVKDVPVHCVGPDAQGNCDCELGR